MNTNDKVYALETQKSEFGIKYFFVSRGQSKIIKQIEYSLVDIVDDEVIFNLGFGDYNIERSTLIDNVNTNNGDAYLVFNTVLTTIPLFFETYRDVTLMVQGSDSAPGFPGICRQTCRKNCTAFCKNADRRITIYRHYVNKNFESLNREYIFKGGFVTSENQIIKESYMPHKKYSSVFVRKKP